MHISGTSGFVEPKIETFTLEKREYIVEERVAVGKLHQRANRYNEYVRLETLVFLHQT